MKMFGPAIGDLYNYMERNNQDRLYVNECFTNYYVDYITRRV